MAQFEVRLRMEIRGRSCRLLAAAGEELPETGLKHGQGWKRALGLFLGRTLEPGQYRAQLREVETVHGALPLLVIHAAAELEGCPRVLDEDYFWAEDPAAATPRLDPGLELELFTDGGSRGNPGPAGIGVVLRQPVTGYEEEYCRYLGAATNNVAEYQALVDGLRLARERGGRHVALFADSELLVRQLLGRYRVKSPDLLPLFEQAGREIAELESFRVSHIPRERNTQADRLANRAMDEGTGKGAANGPAKGAS